MGTGPPRQLVAAGHQVRIPDRLVELDVRPVGKHVDAGHVVDDPLPGHSSIARGLENGVVLSGADRHLGLEHGLQPLGRWRPVELESLGQYRDPGAIIGPIVVYGEAGAVGAPVSHLMEHDRRQSS